MGFVDGKGHSGFTAGPFFSFFPGFLPSKAFLYSNISEIASAPILRLTGPSLTSPLDANTQIITCQELDLACFHTVDGVQPIVDSC